HRRDAAMPRPAEQITPSALRDWPLPQPTGAKGSRGRVVVAGGSLSTPGAAMLAGLAALRVGAGVLALVVAEPVTAVVAAAVPEASVAPLGALREVADGSDALLVGPGLDAVDVAADAVRAGVDAGGPLVLDAYALGALPGLAV